MTGEELLRIADELDAYYRDFGACVARREGCKWLRVYARGQLGPIERKSLEPIADRRCRGGGALLPGLQERAARRRRLRELAALGIDPEQLPLCDEWAFQTNQSRRRFVKLGAIGVVSMPLFGRVALAQERVSEDDPTAQSLHYRHDAIQVDHPSFEEGRNCANCQLYQGRTEGWGGCAIFPGKLVAASGWCTAWVPKA